MTLTEQTIIGSINVTATGHVEVRQDTYILRDGTPIAGPSYHRHVLAPGADVATEDERVIAVAGAVWTPEVIAAEQARARRASSCLISCR